MGSYQPLEASETEHFVAKQTSMDEDAEILQNPGLINVQLQLKWRMKINSLLFCCSLAFMIAGIVFFSKAPSDYWRTDSNYHFEPVRQYFEPPLVSKTVNGTLFDVPKNALRGPPSPETDEAWHRLSEVSSWGISKEDLLKLGKDPDKTVKIDPKFGFGDDKYAVSLDVQHNIHCLNAIRKYLHYDHYYAAELGPVMPLLHEAHRDHCLLILLQYFTCYPSLDLYTYIWVEGQPGPFPDFAVNRQCRSHEAMLEWQAKEFVTDKEFTSGSPESPPPGTYVYPPMPGFEEWMEQENVHLGSH